MLSQSPIEGIKVSLEVAARSKAVKKNRTSESTGQLGNRGHRSLQFATLRNPLYRRRPRRTIWRSAHS